jgi:hypothetical protein
MQPQRSGDALEPPPSVLRTAEGKTPRWVGPPQARHPLTSRSLSSGGALPARWLVRGRLACGKQKTRDRYLGAGIRFAMMTI